MSEEPEFFVRVGVTAARANALDLFQPLTPATWLQALQKSDPYWFAEPVSERAH